MDAGLVLPVVLWDSPPSHVITSLVMTFDKRYLITGSRSGMIGIWTVADKDAPGDEVRLKPHMVLAGCDSPITALALTSRPPTDGFASLSLDGTLCVWDHKAGTCVASVRRLLGNVRCPTRMVALPDRRHVAISGQTADIKIVDLYTMQVVKRIQEHDEWVSAMHSCDLGGVEHHPFLLSLDASGILYFHSMLYLTSEHEPPLRTMYIPTGDEDTDEHDINADDIRLPSGACLSVCVSPAAKTLVVVTSHAWLLYTAGNPRMLFKVDCLEGSSWRGASYVHDLQVLVWDKSGVAYLYDLPKEVSHLDSLVFPCAMVREPPSTMSSSSTSNLYSTNGEMSVASPIPRVPSLPSFRELGSTLAESATRLTTRKSHHASISSFSSPASQSPSPVGDMPGTPTRGPSPRPLVDHLTVFSEATPPASPGIGRSLRIVSVTSDLEPPSGSALAGSRASGVVQTEDADILKLAVGEEASSTSLVEHICNSAPVIRSSLVFPSSDADETTNNDKRKIIGAWDEILAMGDASGSVSLWRVAGGIVKPQHFILNAVDSSQDLSVSESVEFRFDTGLAPWATAKLADGWKGLSDSTSAVVSASLIVEDTLLLVRGYDNGDISIAGLPSQDGPPRVIRRAHSSRVTSLISYETTTAHLLISAGADSVIKVWNLVTAELEHVFSQHAAAVTHLIRPETRGGARTSVAGDVFISVSKDKSVGLFSLDNMNCIHVFGGHPAQIRDVGWRAEQDYIIVQCEDGSVSVWEISSGMLESRISGNSADGIMENTPRLLRRGYGASSHEEERAVTSFTVQYGEHDSPLQVINLNIKKLVQDLYTTMKVPRRHNSRQNGEETGGRSQRGSQPKPAKPVEARSNSEPAKRRSLHGPKIKAKANGAVPREKSGGHRERTNSKAAEETKSKSLLASNSYLLFSYLIPWNTTELLDRICTKDLLLHPPSPHVTFGLKSGDNMMGIMVPTSALSTGRWKSSNQLTALHVLAAVTFTKSLLYLGDEKASSYLLTYFCSMAPETTADYVEPSLLFLTNYYQDPMDDVVQSARALFASSVCRMSADDLSSFARSEASLLAIRPAEERENRILMLAVLGAEKPECLEPSTTQQVVRVLFDILKRKDSPLRLTAAELLGKGFAAWRSSSKDTKALVQSLFALTLMGDTSSITGMAHHSLMQIGAIETRTFIDALSDIVTRSGSSARDRNEALKLLEDLVTEKAPQVAGEVVKLVEAALNPLDPNLPELRNSCQEQAQAVLKAIIKSFPTVSGHKTAQRLAVGTSKGVILIYDLRTATRWHVLDKGHTGPVTAMAYNAEGDKLASYSLVDGHVVVWATKASFFEYFSAAPSPQRCLKGGKADRPIPLPVALKVRLQWAGPRQLQLLRPWVPQDPTTFPL